VGGRPLNYALDVLEPSMGGLNINCGEFFADDKSGSAFERVLSDLLGFDDEVKQEILSGFDDNEYTLIEPSYAAQMISPLKVYRDALIRDIGHSDFHKEIDREQSNGGDPVKLKWGEGRGWRLYCAINLLAACEHSLRHQQPVAICLG
jgi:hypothetical protein